MASVVLTKPFVPITNSVAKAYTAAGILLKSSEDVILLNQRAKLATRRLCAKMTAPKSGTGSKENVLNNILQTQVISLTNSNRSIKIKGV